LRFELVLVKPWAASTVPLVQFVPRHLSARTQKIWTIGRLAKPSVMRPIWLLASACRQVGTVNELALERESCSCVRAAPARAASTSSMGSGRLQHVQQAAPARAAGGSSMGSSMCRERLQHRQRAALARAASKESHAVYYVLGIGCTQDASSTLQSPPRRGRESSELTASWRGRQHMASGQRLAQARRSGKSSSAAQHRLSGCRSGQRTQGGAFAICEWQRPPVQ